MLTPNERLLGELLAREAADSLERAVGWVCLVRHDDHTDFPPTIWGTFDEAPAALAYALERERELNQEGETGFRVLALPILPTP